MPLFLLVHEMTNDTNYTTNEIDHENNAETEAVCRGLSSINKVNEFKNDLKQTFERAKSAIKARLLNKATGEMIEITDELKHKFRLSRMQGRVHAWAESVKGFGGLKGGFRYRQVMITLTFNPSVKWYAKCITQFIQAVLNLLKADLMAYAWVAEMQERGVPHYHVFLITKKGAWIPTPDKPHGQRKTKLWAHGSTNTQNAKSPYYLVKYTEKNSKKKAFIGACVFLRFGLLKMFLAN